MKAITIAAPAAAPEAGFRSLSSREQCGHTRFPLTKGRKDIMPRNSPKDRPLATPAPPSDQDLPANGPGDEYAQPVVKGRVRPTRSREEANVDPDEALPNDEEEESIADNPSREEVRFGEVKSPRP
jgi:hypothetical protein